MRKLFYSPLWLVLSIGTGVVIVLLLRGLDIGPLHSDVMIHYAWIDEIGIDGFPARYFDINQRHPLVGPIIALAYRVFGRDPVPYHLIFQFSRVLEGAFLAGIVFQLTERRLLAVCAGLVLMLTPLRLAELYQGINWYIEFTLALLLASTYIYMLFLKHKWRILLLLSFVCYAVSVLIYESGIPWISVNLLVGWFVLEGQPWRERGWRLARHAIPSLLVGLGLVVAVLFIWEPWQVLKPQTDSSIITRLIEQMGTAVTFPLLVLDRLHFARIDGYVALIAGAASLAGCVLLLLGWLSPAEDRDHVRRDAARLIVLALVMLFASVLFGISSDQMNHVYADRITFGRAAGISLLYVTLIFSGAYLLHTRWYGLIAAAVTGVLLVGPGFAWLLSYQDYARATRDDIEHMTTATLEIRRVMYAPVHIVVITDPNWPGARFPDAVDVVTHEVQQNLWERGGDATIDLIKKGNAGIDGEWETIPGSCRTVSGEGQAGICLDADHLSATRFSASASYPYDNVVVVRYDHDAGTMTIVSEVNLADLDDYNITTAGDPVLRTNRERLAVPLE